MKSFDNIGNYPYPNPSPMKIQKWLRAGCYPKSPSGEKIEESPHIHPRHLRLAKKRRLAEIMKPVMEKRRA